MSKVIDNIEDIASIDSKVAKVTSTDNAIARYDGTGGAIQNSNVYIDDNGRLGVGITTPGQQIDARFTDATAYSSSAAGNGLSCRNLSTSANVYSGIYLAATGNTTYTASASINLIHTGDGSGALALNTRNSSTTAERMRIDSSGNVGIGTSSPNNKLTVQGTTGQGITISSSATTTGAINTGPIIAFEGHDGSSERTFAQIKALKENGTVGNYSTYMSFLTRANGGVAAERMRIDSSGNVGIGVTPSAWDSTYFAGLEIGANLSLYGRKDNSNDIGIASNGYRSSGGTWKYKASNYAALYTQYNGNHTWGTAPSGTAGNAITWSQPMTLNANGNLLVGTTTDNGVDKLQVNGRVKSEDRQKFSGTVNGNSSISFNVGRNTCCMIQYETTHNSGDSRAYIGMINNNWETTNITQIALNDLGTTSVSHSVTTVNYDAIFTITNNSGNQMDYYIIISSTQPFSKQ